MAPPRETSKSWSVLKGDIADTFRKWRRRAPTLEYTAQPRSAAKRYQTREERAVRLTFKWGLSGRSVSVEMAARPRAIDNLAALATAVEMIRLAEVRGVTEILVVLYRQMYPAEPPKPAPAPPPPQLGAEPWATLHLAPGAPPEVVEAAYRALARLHHPDRGGDTAAMQRINAAAEQLRRGGS